MVGADVTRRPKKGFVPVFETDWCGEHRLDENSIAGWPLNPPPSAAGAAVSIWLHAAAGGLQGLGTSIATADAEKREARGLALREKYLAARQGKQHTFTARTETQLTRDLSIQAGESDR